MTSGLAHVTTVRKTPVARQPASTFWALPWEIIRLRNLNGGVLMPRATETQGVTDCVRCAEQINDFLPHRDVRISIRITDEIHPMLGTANEDVNSVRRPQETHTFLDITPNQRHND